MQHQKLSEQTRWLDATDQAALVASGEVTSGELVEAAIDRAARLADGHFAYSFSDPEAQLAAMYERRIAPALERHGRSAQDFQPC